MHSGIPTVLPSIRITPPCLHRSRNIKFVRRPRGQTPSLGASISTRHHCRSRSSSWHEENCLPNNHNPALKSCLRIGYKPKPRLGYLVVPSRSTLWEISRLPSVRLESNCIKRFWYTGRSWNEKILRNHCNSVSFMNALFLRVDKTCVKAVLSVALLCGKYLLRSSWQCLASILTLNHMFIQETMHSLWAPVFGSLEVFE